MRKMIRLFAVSFCMVFLIGCGEQRKQVVYEEQGPFEVFPTLTTEAIPYRIPSITKTSKGNLLAVADYRPCRADIGYGRDSVRRHLPGHHRCYPHPHRTLQRFCRTHRYLPGRHFHHHRCRCCS